MKKKPGIDIPLSTPMNLNDPKELGAAMNELAFNLKSMDEPYHRDGIWLEQASKGFVSAMAAAKQENWSIDDQINASINAYALFFALMIGASCRDETDALVASTNICGQFSKTVLNLVMGNIANARPCGPDGSAEKILKH